MSDKNLETVAELEKAIVALEEENRVYRGAINMSDPDYYDDLIAKNEERISQLKAKLDQLKKTDKSDDLEDKKAETDKVRADLLELKDKLYNYLMSVYTLKERNYDLLEEEKMISNIEDYIRNYKGILSSEELGNINAEYDVDRRLRSDLGEELSEFARKYLVYYTKLLGDLHSADYGTKEYDAARKRFDSFLAAAKNLDGKHNISVSFNEDTQVFTMDFDGKLPTISNQVVNNGTLDKIKEASKKAKPENVEDKYEEHYKALIDDEMRKVNGHFKGIDKLSEAELADIFKQAPNREDYDGLSGFEADIIDSMMRGYRFSILEGNFNNDLAYIIDLYLEILSIKSELSKVEFDSDEFKELKERLIEDIEQIKTYNDLDEINVEFDPDSWFLKVTVKDGKMDNLEVPENFIEAQVVSDKTLKELQAASKKSASFNGIEKILESELRKPILKYLIWFEDVLTLKTDYSDEEADKYYDEINKVFENKKFDSISQKRKEEIRDKILDEKEEHLKKKYGEDLYKLLLTFSTKYKKRLNRLKSATYGTPEFEEALKNMQELIEKARKVDGVTVNYNEEVQSLSIKFGKANIVPIIDQLISKEALEAMRKDKSSRPNPNAEEQFRTDYEVELEKFSEYIENTVFKKHIFNDEEEKKYKNELKEYRKAYNGVSEERKQAIHDELTLKLNQKLIDKYSKDLCNILYSTLAELQDAIQRLKNATYGTREFDAAKLQVDDLLAEIKANPNITVTYNEDNQNLSIKFANLEIEPIFATVMSKEAIDAMKNDKSSNPDPKLDTDKDKKGPDKPDKSIQASIDEYVARVEEINNMIDELGRMNTIQDASIDPLSPAYMDTVIENEKIAREYESLINKNRLELSKFRMDFTKKYGKYIFSYPEVKNTKIKEVTYSESLEDITKKVDEIIIRAEYERTRDNINQTEIDKLNEYIDAQNAMISRRLIHKVATDSSYDSKKYLDERRKEKQAQRKQILQQEKGPEFIENYTIKGTSLNFNPTVRDKIDTSKAVVISATDQINVELYKSRIVIKMTKQVKDRLAKLKTAIKLTNKHGDEQVIDVKRGKPIEFGANGEDLSGLGLEIVSQDPSISDEAMYSLDLEEVKNRTK